MNIDARGIKEGTVFRNWKNFCRAEPAGPRIKGGFSRFLRPRFFFFLLLLLILRTSLSSLPFSFFSSFLPLLSFQRAKGSEERDVSPVRATSDDDCDEDFNKLVKRSADWQLLLLSSDGSGTGSFPPLFRFSFNFYSFRKQMDDTWSRFYFGFDSIGYRIPQNIKFYDENRLFWSNISTISINKFVY